MDFHQIDIYPIPENETPRFINEPWLIDKSIWCDTVKELEKLRQPEGQPDNIRIYLPLDLNQKAFLRRLDYVISHYGEANEDNESDFSADVRYILDQVEIYDKIWRLRSPGDQRHSEQVKQLMRAFIQKLEQIPDGCAECFPFEMIDELTKEYLEE